MSGPRPKNHSLFARCAGLLAEVAAQNRDLSDAREATGVSQLAFDNARRFIGELPAPLSSPASANRQAKELRVPRPVSQSRQWRA